MSFFHPTQRVIYSPHEFADLVALETLARGVGNVPGVSFYFEETAKDVKYNGLPYLHGFKFSKINPKTSLVVASYSDWTAVEASDAKTLQVDQMIMKNSGHLVTPAQRAEYRKEYGMPDDIPSLIVGFANDASAEELEELIYTALPYAKIYLVCGHYPLMHEDVPYYEGNEDRITVLNSFGILSKVYAGGDAAVFGSNLSTPRELYHNFVEATAGGPLFTIPPLYPKFGFDELSQAGCVRISNWNADLLQDLEDYLAAFRPETREAYYQGPAMQREQHILETRDKYIPVLKSHILSQLGLGTALPSDIKIVRKIGPCGQVTRLLHPNTQWTDKDQLFTHAEGTVYIHSNPEQKYIEAIKMMHASP